MIYPRDELLAMGFRSLDDNVEIDTRTTVDNPDTISIGNNVKMGSFVAISNYVRLITHSDDYSGDSITAPFIPDIYKPKQYGGEIVIKNHCIVGSGSCILPSVTMEIGSALGAMSMLKDSTFEFGVYAGIPARRIKERSRKMISLEKEFLRSNK